MGCSISDPSLPAPFSLDGAATPPLPDLRFLAIFPVFFRVSHISYHNRLLCTMLQTVPTLIPCI
jgi:hypothetical protein